MPTRLSQLYCPVYSLPVISLEGQKPSPLSVYAHSTLKKITLLYKRAFDGRMSVVFNWGRDDDRGFGRVESIEVGFKRRADSRAEKLLMLNLAKVSLGITCSEKC